jgi:hypothetical protein
MYCITTITARVQGIMFFLILKGKSQLKHTNRKITRTYFNNVFSMYVLLY